jgi:hypothetical protein
VYAWLGGVRALRGALPRIPSFVPFSSGMHTVFLCCCMIDPSVRPVRCGDLERTRIS